MLARSSRSRSRTADPAPSNNSASLTNHLSRPSPASKISNHSLPVSDPAIAQSTPFQDTKTMISTITNQRASASLDPLARAKHADAIEPVDSFDSRSSSLSDLDEANDDRADISSRDPPKFDDMEVDSEAETERLENTPRKLTSTGSLISTEKSPSKLGKELLLESSIEGTEMAPSDIPPTTLSLHSTLSPPRDTTTTDDTEVMDRDSELQNRKRKRSASAASSLSEADEPLAKRSHSSKYTIDTAVPSAESLHTKDANLDQGIERPKEDAVHGDEQNVNGVNLEEDELEVLPAEPVLPTKGRRGKKGKRKGKKANNGTESETIGEPPDIIGEYEAEPAEGEIDEEEDSSRDEELTKKRSAMAALSNIEKEFSAFREKHINDQLRQVTSELELLKQPNSTHQEYQLQLRCIDERRDEKIRYEDTIFRYKFEALKVKTVAERTQLHSQYVQDVREIRDRWLERCYQDLYALQKDRRRWGADETNYNYLYNPKRPQQIQQQTAYNVEVSILSGIAKHVGFPAAPDISGLQSEEVDADFRAMTIPDRPAQARIMLRDAERVAAEKEFFEQNAWANPSVAHAMLQSQAFSTPIAQNRSNGSTVDLVMSAPTSAQQTTPQARDATQTPTQSAKIASSTKSTSRAHDTERIHTTHSSSVAISAPPQDSSTSALSSETPLPTQAFPTSALHSNEPKDVYGVLAQATPALTAPVGGSSSRFPP